MNFNSFTYLFFLVCVVITVFCVPRKYKCPVLLIADYIFYSSFNIKYPILLILITAISYITARFLEKDFEEGKRKKILIIGISLCVIILICFKYIRFLVENLAFVFNNFSLIQDTLLENIILPVGISFYIFQAIGYMVDAYRDKEKIEKQVLVYATFLSFFPQLVSGPIERGTHMFQQYRYFGTFDYSRVRDGILLMCWGYFEKMTIANRAVLIVDEVYGNTSQYAGAQIIVAMLAFSIQIYADFAGYTHIAIGSAQILGIQLQENFKQPYFAVGIKDFWRRWHISLSKWLRDYLYIPLGGSRCGKARNRFNILLTFLISGIWHGAGWNFIIWGGMHGGMQILEKTGIESKEKSGKVKHFFDICVTFLCVTIAWVFFRCDTVEQVRHLFVRIFSTPFLDTIRNDALFQMGLKRANCFILLAAIVVLFIVDILHEKEIHIRQWVAKQTITVRWGIYIIVCTTLLLQILNDFGMKAGNFIYAQF